MATYNSSNYHVRKYFCSIPSMMFPFYGVFEWILVSPLLFLPFSCVVFAGSFFCRSLGMFPPRTFFSAAHCSFYLLLSLPHFPLLTIFSAHSIFFALLRLFPQLPFFCRSIFPPFNFLQLTLSFLHCKWFDNFSRYSLFCPSFRP